MVEITTKYEVHQVDNDAGRIEWCESDSEAEQLADELTEATGNRHVVIEV